MSQELLYTSAPRGLKPGSRGFCTVMCTKGMPAPLAAALESLSGYRPLFPPGHPDANRNPIALSHVILNVGGKRYNVISRVADYGLDYTQRTNKIAHHVALAGAERPAGGPAWLQSQPDFMRTEWEGEPTMAPPRATPKGDSLNAPCDAWATATGDAGWAGVLADSYLNRSDRTAYVIYDLSIDPLRLIAEAMSLLPAPRRWEPSYSTYFSTLPKGVECHWRFLPSGAPEVESSRRFTRALRLDLTQPIGAPTGNSLVEAARTGIIPSPKKVVKATRGPKRPAVANPSANTEVVVDENTQFTNNAFWESDSDFDLVASSQPSPRTKFRPATPKKSPPPQRFPSAIIFGGVALSLILLVGFVAFVSQQAASTVTPKSRVAANDQALSAEPSDEQLRQSDGASNDLTNEDPTPASQVPDKSDLQSDGESTKDSHKADTPKVSNKSGKPRRQQAVTQPPVERPVSREQRVPSPKPPRSETPADVPESASRQGVLFDNPVKVTPLTLTEDRVVDSEGLKNGPFDVRDDARLDFHFAAFVKQIQTDRRKTAVKVPLEVSIDGRSGSPLAVLQLDKTENDKQRFSISWKVQGSKYGYSLHWGLAEIAAPDRPSKFYSFFPPPRQPLSVLKDGAVEWTLPFDHNLYANAVKTDDVALGVSVLAIRVDDVLLTFSQAGDDSDAPLPLKKMKTDPIRMKANLAETFGIVADDVTTLCECRVSCVRDVRQSIDKLRVELDAGASIDKIAGVVNGTLFDDVIESLTQPFPDEDGDAPNVKEADRSLSDGNWLASCRQAVANWIERMGQPDSDNGWTADDIEKRTRDLHEALERLEDLTATYERIESFRSKWKSATIETARVYFPVPIGGDRDDIQVDVFVIDPSTQNPTDN